MAPLTRSRKHRTCTNTSTTEDNSSTVRRRPAKTTISTKKKKNENVSKRDAQPSTSERRTSSRLAASTSSESVELRRQPDPKPDNSLASPDFSDSYADIETESRNGDQKLAPEDDIESNIELVDSSEISPVKLLNGQNWCYLNSVFQALRSAQPMNEYLSIFPVAFMEISEVLDDAKLAFSFINDFQKVMSSPKDDDTSTQELTNTRNTILSNSSGAIRGSTQQDAHEFLNELTNSVDNLEELMSSILQIIPTELRPRSFKDILTGITKVLLVCQECSAERSRFEQWTSLSLPVPRSSDISSMIESHFSKCMNSDNLDCAGCKKKTLTIRSDILVNGPKVLVVQLQNAKVENNALMKTGYVVHVPEVFGVIDESRSVCVYELSGAIVHIGQNVTSGHYVAYGFDADETCVRFDDRFFERFLPERNDGNVHFHTAHETPYLLIYTKSEKR